MHRTIVDKFKGEIPKFNLNLRISPFIVLKINVAYKKASRKGHNS